MSSQITDLCPQCGTPLASGAIRSGCLYCLLSVGLEEFDTEDGGNRLYHHYQIIQQDDGSPCELGSGAMGVTYKALDIHLQIFVALKVINQQLSAQPTIRQRFLREARLAARVHHPNIATVFHFGVKSSVPGTDITVATQTRDQECYYVMEFIEGETLEERVHRAGPLLVDEALVVAHEVARALAAAELQQLVHRDLKPSNIMLRNNGQPGIPHGEAWVKVIDFGLARAMGEDFEPINRDGAANASLLGFLGTPQFASPEQFAGAPLDVRSDIFSLGATLCYALTGRAPLESVTPPGIDDSQKGALIQSSWEKHHLPLRIISLLEWMLARNPAQRPASASALLAAIDECAGALRNPEDARDPQTRQFIHQAEAALHSGYSTKKKTEDAIALLEEG